MADTSLYIQSQKYSLSAGITSTATSITLSSFKTIDGSTITDSDIGSGVFITIDPGNSREEVVKCTAITQNANGTATITVTRGIAFQTPYTADTSLRQAHSAGAVAVISNSAAFYNTFVNKGNDETMTGYLSGPEPLANADYATKNYVDTNVNGGTVSIDTVIVAGNAGETIAAGELVYFDSVTNNEWMLADADTAAKAVNVLLGIAQGAGTDGNTISGGVLIAGIDSNQTGMTIGDVMYASDTAGAIASSAGTLEVTVGIAKSATELYFSPRFNQGLSEAQQDALDSAAGSLSSTNVVISQDAVFYDSPDQAEATNDGTVEVGEADATTRKNKIAQSFKPSKSKVRGVRLFKETDTGTFTGTVTIALHLDATPGTTATEPAAAAISGATVTITNADWGNIADDSEFEAIFGTEASGLTPGNVHWIVISTSTSDTTNHPNIGTSASGGYGDGSVMYNNTTDGWTAIASIDLTFETLHGVIDQVVGTDSNGVIKGVLKKPTVTTVTATGTWTKPDDLSYVFVELVGGGGGGATANTAGPLAGGGGGGGGYSAEYIPASSLSDVETVTVGAGGTAGSGSGGGTGGTTSFGTSAFLQATGGGGGTKGDGAGSGPTGGTGGIGSGGDINLRGGSGGPGTSDAGADSETRPGANGGDSKLGGGAAGGMAGGATADGYGGGGAGSGSNANGGAGAAGVVIIHEFY